MPIVLCVLAVGSLTIVASLNYSSTILKSERVIKQNIDGIYAASSGIDHAIWSLLKGVPPLTQLPEQINRMSVNISTINSGNFTLYLGELEDGSGKAGVLTVTSNLTFNGTVNGTDMYRYDITVVRQNVTGPTTLHLQEVGARLPVGFTYNGSASRSDNQSLGSGNPIKSQDAAGAWMVQWKWGSSIRPTLKNNPLENTFVLSFYITGTGNAEGEYAWTVADATGYGLYGELSGGRYIIIADAVRPGDNRTMTRITADVMIQGDGTNYITSWKITN